MPVNARTRRRSPWPIRITSLLVIFTLGLAASSSDRVNAVLALAATAGLIITLTTGNRT